MNGKKTMMINKKVSVIGAGLAGCEAAWTLAKNNIPVDLYEMKPDKKTPAQKSDNFAELVCSNSLKAERINSAAGLLKAEMQKLGSLTVETAYECKVPAGGALAVDRNLFSKKITEKIKSNENIKVHENCEITEIPDGYVIIATGPLTSDAMSKKIEELCGKRFSFFDAAAPVVSGDSINKEKAFFRSRYDRGTADYLNCPMEKDEYEAFYENLIHAQKAPLNEFDKRDFRVYEGCMPIEELASRGIDTMRFGPLKPVGIYYPGTNKRPYAVVQLRKENEAGSMYNIVGFQTNLKFGEQKRVFSMIPGLENAEFLRYGVMHRNFFLDSPKLLADDYSYLKDDRIYFAGQMTGVEGYMESASSGIAAATQLV